jgi:uncharacterized membrane protein
MLHFCLFSINHMFRKAFGWAQKHVSKIVATKMDISMQNQVAAPAAKTPIGRIALLDVARGIAMIAMTIFHFSWDLEFFGYAPLGMTSQFGWKLFARTIAASFLLIAGISLMFAHIDGVRWRAFWRRFAMVAGAALIISTATYYTTPERFVFFGILHQIAAACLIALLFMRLPALSILGFGIAVLALPFYFRNELFLEPYFWWSGLAPYDPPSNDYVPVFPWTGFVLLGMAIAKFGVQSGLALKLSTVKANQGPFGRALSVLGNYSLIYYLLHQPAMIALLYGLTFVFPPAPIDKAALFIPQCTLSCQSERDAAFCERFCSCVRTEFEKQAIFSQVLDGKRDMNSDPIVLDIASVCTGASED